MARFYRLVIALAAIAAGCIHAETRTYALVAAMGTRFEVIYEVQSTGSHLPPYDRKAFAFGDNVLNRLALQGLDQAIARIDPASRRVFLSTDPGGRGMGHVLSELRKLDRAGWDAVLVALPAYRRQSKEGLPPHLRGMGLFAQPLCESDVRSCELGFRPPSGPVALTPEGKEIAANTFAAPFVFVEVLALDPKTLEVRERGISYGHRKLTDASAQLTGVIDGSNRDFLAAQIVQTVQSAAAEAAYEALQGKVVVEEKGPVAP